jgi:hypothetical protein
VATPWEKGLVALALLRAAGLQPELGLFTHTETFASDVPAASSFGHVRVTVIAGGENWWLAPDRGEPWTGRCDLAGRTGIFLEDGGGQRRYTVTAAPARALLVALVRPTAGEPSDPPWTAEIEFSAAEAFWPAGSLGDDVAQKLAAAVLPGGEVDAIVEEEVDGRSGRLRLTARGPALERDAAGTWRLPVPDGAVALAQALPDGHVPAAGERRTPLRCERPLTWELRWRVVLPDSLAADHLPPDVDLAAAGTDFTRTTSATAAGCELHLRLETQAGWIAPGDVAAWRDVVREPLLPRSRAVVLRRE